MRYAFLTHSPVAPFWTRKWRHTNFLGDKPLSSYSLEDGTVHLKEEHYQQQ